ncbi:rod shape-determining protein MreD [Oscillatoriales cyanobacterium LEGE 11467]|uniref:Rod shape-determining protein MreD n=1 Tax=Zarconia navalis LEGE 11467 TaxID=1828826 RepID=A0A928VXM8_9CYAN|nr:rod shape-determining protein MreD [Zarconia navalis]MBE9040156.1 rod shape-determining protein MreD [Zarconia navalis LEGE 11467]
MVSRKTSFVTPLARWPSWMRRGLDAIVTVGSLLLCLLLLPTRIPGMELLGIGPNWLLIWVVAWSLNRTVWQGVLAGLTIGIVQDGMSSSHPTHAASLIAVGVLAARLQKQRYIQEDFISVALVVFGMSVVAETVTALQFSIDSLWGDASGTGRSLSEIWTYHQRVTLASAILSSLWAPAIYFPLDRWWGKMNLLE